MGGEASHEIESEDLIKHDIVVNEFDREKWLEVNSLHVHWLAIKKRDKLLPSELIPKSGTSPHACIHIHFHPSFCNVRDCVSGWFVACSIINYY